MKPFWIFLVLVLSASALYAQGATCIFDHSDVGVTMIRYRDNVRYPVCAHCLGTLPRCAECHHPTNEKPYRDGRIICKVCQATGVFTNAQIKPVEDGVEAFLKGIIGYSTPPPVEVVDKDELQTRFTAGGRSMDVAGFYRPYNPEMVYILSGALPLEEGGVLAHEMTHAWQSRNCPPQDRALTEGFATWVEYYYYTTHNGADLAQRCTEMSDPDYGASLVSLLAREKQMGRPAFLEWVKKAHDLNSR